MKYKLILLTLIFVLSSARPAFAFVVFDPSNFAQNCIQAVRELKSNLNEAQMIKNQLQSLQNEFRNLKSLDYSSIEELSDSMNELFEVVGTVEGMMQDFQGVQERFDELYPDISQMTAIDGETAAQYSRRWLEEMRNTVSGAAKTGAKVLDSLPANQDQLDTLLNQSQGAEGILQSAQAGNQIAGLMVDQLQSLNAQLAQYNQVNLNEVMVQQSHRELSAERDSKAMDGFGERKSRQIVPLLK